MLLEFREKRFARQTVRRLMHAYSSVRAASPDLSGKALYREVLLHTRQVDLATVDQLLSEAEDSVDDWTSPESNGFGLREVAHFFVMSQYLAAGHAGTVVSLRDIVHTLIPENL